MSTHPDRQHEDHARRCPVTDRHCYDPVCSKIFCLLERHKKEIPPAAELLIGIVAEQVHIIKGLLKEKTNGPAKSLAVVGVTGVGINAVSFFNVKNNKHMSVSFKKAGGAIATIKGFDVNGNETLNGIDLTKPITATSNHPEFFTADIVKDAAGVPTLPLQAKLNGVDDGSATITYSCTNTDGEVVSLVDNVVVADVPPVKAAKTLGVDYTVF